MSEEKSSAPQNCIVKKTLSLLPWAAGGAAVFILLMELLVFPAILQSVPLKFRGALPYALRPLVELSKNAAVPKDYIAIFGDSYSFGEGDWIIDSDKSTNPKHGPADILHDATGENFISFGQSGKGSLIYLASAPANFYRFYQKTWKYRLGKPKAIAVFFYEGNDFNNNLEDIILRFQPKYDLQRVMEPAYFREFIEKEVIPIHPAYEEVRRFGLGGQFVFTNWLLRILRGQYPHDIHMAPLTKAWKGVTFANIGGQNVPLPNELEGPGMEISDQNIILPLYVFEQSLAYLSSMFPGIKIIVFYVPSPLTSYTLTSEFAANRSYTGRGEASFKTEDIRRRSDFGAKMIETIATTQGHGFVDTRPAMLKASSQAYVHGPKDWDHYNRYGIEALGEAVRQGMVRYGFIADGRR